MDLFTAVEARRSIKHYDASAQMSSSEFHQLIQATMLSPTSYNIQHWRFLRVTDPALRSELKDAAWGQEQVEDASELIILCADINAWKDRPERYWADAPKEVQAVLVPMLTSFYEGKPQLQRDEAIRSCGLAAQTMMLAAKAQGYDSGAMVGFDPDRVAEIINLPDSYLIGMIIVVGKAKKSAKGRGGQLPMDEVLFENSF
ncbi:nitroreductase family protein [Microbulbifer sp. OS29]|uniref:Nitroreductase family protein n=1 Tax=Microbulbifer okhotskensis TaxID=2926617 RepID=A0A9X2EM42_9GAMM|nr:nitroreductase family protein [Microbulbifer okhotskensis]MCO1334774.1 nitroreductase family protein [Microbulbifer okhotskensis]